MKLYPETITHLGSSKYRVRIQVLDPDEVLEFDFLVKGDDIRVVVWTSEFADLLHHNIAPAKHLLAAILALDMSRGAVAP